MQACYFYPLFFLVFFKPLLIICESNLLVEYYKNLIDVNIQAAKEYTPPEGRNVEFEEGSKASILEDYGKFDFIVVGAGSAGSVIATRLSEIENWDILVLEAGGFETDFSLIPSMGSYLWNSPMDWGYRTVPQKFTCFDLDGSFTKKCLVPRGKVVGGTSAVNGAHYARGNRHDFDSWEEMGLTNWNYDEALKYFRKSENSQLDGDIGYHGKGGLLNVEFAEPTIPTLDDFMEANRELGEVTEIDYNGRQQVGVGRIQMTTRNGKRDSTGTAFLDTARRRTNLNITTHTLVTKLLINETTRIVEGVSFIHGNRKFQALVRKEVILSAGSINTPQILLISGLGPKNHLEEINVKPIVDLSAVGENLADHASIDVVFNANLNETTLDMDKEIRQYLRGFGPLSKTATADAVNFRNMPGIPKSVPMYEILYNTISNVMHFNVMLQHPVSRGNVTLKSNDPIDHPLINTNFLDNPLDKERLIDGIKFIFNLTRTKALGKYNPVFQEKIDSCGDFDANSDDYWVCYMMNVFNFSCHPIGTTRMGISSENSVVDGNLKVHGMKNLRIIDAGVVPSTLSGHINAPVIMIAEKGADIIKIQHGINIE